MTKTEFLQNVNPWGNHRNLLWAALEATKALHLPVIELGSGPSSTPYLRQYCKDNGLPFETYETDRVWSTAMKSRLVLNWDSETFWVNHYGVCLLDCAPGEYRKVALMKLKAEIIILHDSEPKGWNASDYQVRPLFKNFKYVIDEQPKDMKNEKGHIINFAKGSPWTSALSNTIDVTKFLA
jgi:hypothetical protein